MNVQRWFISGSLSLGISVLAFPAFADGYGSAYAALPSQAALQTALEGAAGVSGNGDLGFNMWGQLLPMTAPSALLRFQAPVHRSVAG